MNKDIAADIKKDGIRSVIIAFVKWIGELIFGDIVLNSLKGMMGENFLTKTFEWSINNHFLSTLLFLLLMFVVFISLDFLLGLFGQNKLSLVHRSGKIYEGVWDSYYAWLEIVGDTETDKYIGILKKLESKKGDTVTNHLVEITKSSSPKLKFVDEKLFVAETKVTDVVISLKNGQSRFLPKEVHRFYFEVELLNGKKKVSAFKGYLVGGYPDLHIEPA